MKSRFQYSLPSRDNVAWLAIFYLGLGGAAIWLDVLTTPWLIVFSTFILLIGVYDAALRLHDALLERLVSEMREPGTISAPAVQDDGA